MRNKTDFENLVYEKADALAAKEHKHTIHRKAALSTAAAFTVLTAVAVGSVFTFKDWNLSAKDGVNAANLTAAESAENVQDYENNGVGADDLTKNFTNDFDYDYSNGAQISEDNICDFEDEDGLFDNDDDSYEVKEEGEAQQRINPEVYKDLPVQVKYYTHGSLEKVITDEEEIDSLIHKLRNAEQVRVKNQDDTEVPVLFDIEREDKENSVTYVKEYGFYKNYVNVSEFRITAYKIDEENFGEYRDSYSSYSFGISDDLLDIMREYFDEDFTFGE